LAARIAAAAACHVVPLSNHYLLAWRQQQLGTWFRAEIIGCMHGSSGCSVHGSALNHWLHTRRQQQIDTCCRTQIIGCTQPYGGSSSLAHGAGERQAGMSP